MVLIFKKFVIAFVALVFTGLLSACDSSEERAEKHFQSAMALLEEGDAERAIVEFRNVFKLDGLHKEARVEYAELQRRRGNIREAMVHYLHLVEQFPDDIDSRISLTELNIQTGSWDEAERHANAASEIQPDDPIVQALGLAVDYRNALEEKDTNSAQKIAYLSNTLREQLPDYKILRQIVINDLIQNSDLYGALSEIDTAIENEPEDLTLYQLRLSVLGGLGDNGGIEDQLVEMVSRFPQEPTIRSTLVRWFVSRGEIDRAEEFLRDAIDPSSDDNTDRLNLVRFLAELRGQDVAIAELDQIISTGSASSVFSGLRAGMVFESVDREKGIAEMRAILEVTEVSDEQRNIKIGLAKMLVVTGNSVGARALVEEVLAEDSSNVDALKQKANWLIGDDQVGEAIIALRTALDQKPRDAEIMTLMARSYERDGNQELVGEMLSLAVDASNHAPAESIRYAAYLTKRDESITAEEILIDALRIAPANVQILTALGNIYVKTEDWSRAEQVAATLGKLDGDAAKNAQNSITASILQAQNKTAEVISHLENLIAQGEGGVGAYMAIIRSHLASGDADAARSYVQGLLEADPDNAEIRFIDAAVNAALGDIASAEKTYHELLEENEKRSRVWVALFRMLTSQNRPEEAASAANKGLEANPEDPTLLWIRAGLLERQGDTTGAIEIYETMYAKNSGNLIVANNLASLLSTASEDKEAVNRAYTIARRLRSANVAPFQDTFGWIALLRGENETALRSLEPAAAALGSDPMVQYHLARAFLAVNRDSDALVQFIKVLDLTGAGDSRKFVEESRTEVNRLQLAEKSESSD